MKDMQKSRIHLATPTLVWLGDPCYAPELEKEWDKFCDALFASESYRNKEPSHVFEKDGVEFVVGGTAHGDGCYPVSSGGMCGVDAGLLSVIPAGKFGLDPDGENDYGGVFVTAHGDCYMDEDGTLHAGRITVETDREDDEDCCAVCGEEEWNCECDY